MDMMNKHLLYEPTMERKVCSVSGQIDFLTDRGQKMSVDNICNLDPKK